MNSGAASLSVIDMTTRRETRRIPVLREPHHWALTPDRKELLIGDSSGNELLVLDPVHFTLLRRMPMSNPYHLAFSPDGRFFVVAGLARNQVDVYEAGTYKLLKRFALRSMPSHMDFLADSSTVFLSLQGTGRIVAIDLRALEVLWNEPCGSAPAGVLVHGGQVLTGNMGSDDVAVLDAGTGRELRRIRTGKGAHTLFWSPDRRTIWVNNRLDTESVVVLDAATLEPVRRYRLPGGPDDLEFAPDGKVWFTMRFIHKVAVLDPPSGEFDTIEVGRSPHGIFLNPKAVAAA
ncbi:MAG: YncE family protein [Acetobacteraceae bacterium]|nr:YncE family protein [Acetobacteraceae bacterium]